ncbi:TetR/AcrR family transcriptional regulator [Mammaliicoccus sciuri]|uniref:TetR/AcrR family transcriptional regulator n=1 Tax=Mammaliicoccus sciuri TaxID=1296 RepID=UPI001FB277C6|nr:TetR/AcrR family transcriptional regulator [Mammaliicoccus sciuri]MCJ0968418.1 TetR/AcrR family transcriptional regulator [Mammaliicoccus sciuri]
MMNDAFYNLDEEKRQKIINSGLMEFSNYGYQQSSTNRIVENAGIGKGMLFYYFKNKKGLFKFLVDYSLDFIEEYYFKQIDTSEKDIFNRLVKQAKIKSNLMTIHPHMSKFLTKIVLEESEHHYISEEQYQHIEQLQSKVQNALFEDLERALFKEDLNVEMSINIIKYSIDGLAESMKTRITHQMIEQNDYQSFYDEFDLYIKEMRKIFYKDRD